jgi:formylglycine-generating enzyme required for sulfatase activity
MLNQSSNVLPPANVVAPPHLFRKPVYPATSTLTPLPPSSFSAVPLGPLRLGLNDSEKMDENLSKEDVKTHIYGWDNESPQRTVILEMKAEIQTRPVTVLEYAEFLLSYYTTDLKPHGKKLDLEDDVPASWVWSSVSKEEVKLDGIQVKTVFGLVGIHVAKNWPVYVSGAQAERYALAKGLRLPTEYEYTAFRTKHEDSAPPSPTSVNGGVAGMGIHSESGKAHPNFGFRSWVPVDVEEVDGPKSSKLVGNGWEWTSSAWEEFEGYEKSQLYPGYSSDFL